MIHPMEAPIFGEGNEGAKKKQRRYSWSTVSEDKIEELATPKKRPEVSAELANVLWGGMFQSMHDRLFPKTVGDALEILMDAVGEGKAGFSEGMSKRFPDVSVPLKLVDAHMTNKSADLICACVGHDHDKNSLSNDHRPSIIEKPKVLLLRRDETYDLVLNFDRDIHVEIDQVELVLELDDHLFNIPGFNTITFPVVTLNNLKPNLLKHWWATFIDLKEKKAIIRLHVCHTARVGKWRMKVLTNLKNTDKKIDRDMAVAFQRLHIAMSPDQMDNNAAALKSRRFSKCSLNSKET